MRITGEMTCTTSAPFLNIEKLKRNGKILVAARHNLREILAELGASGDGRIDPSRTANNVILVGPKTAAEVVTAASELLDQAGIKNLRKDAVQALEVVISLPIHAPCNRFDFFSEAVNWTGAYFGAPILSAVIHLDEATPHCHILVLPLVGGRMVGSDLCGGKAKMRHMHVSFNEKVGSRFGLAKPASSPKLTGPAKLKAVGLVSETLKARFQLPDDLVKALMKPHYSNPAPIMAMLELVSQPVKRQKSFVEIMTQPCGLEAGAVRKLDRS